MGRNEIMTRHLAQPGLSRRGLLKGASALGASALLLPFGMRSAMAQPKPGGIFRLAMGHGSTSDGYDPALWDQDFASFFATARHCFLTEIGPGGQLVGEIAESWESADAITWVLKIREGVSFHSGKLLTVDDVIASLNHHRGAESVSAAKPIVESITDLRADGWNLVVTLSSGNADFPFILSDYHLPVMPSVDGKLDVMSPDGCGPYVVTAYEPGVSASMTKNPNYWKPGRAHFDGIELLSIFDSAARQNALLTDAVDMIDGVDLATVALLERAPGVKVLTTNGTQHYLFAMDYRAAPYSDNNVRLALKYAMDREEIVAKILNGYGVVGNDHPIGQSNRYFNTELPQKAYDPDKAKYYLGQAGLTSLDVTLSVSNAAFDGAIDAGVLFSEKAAVAGINLTVENAPDDGYWDNVWMKKPFCASYWSGRPTEDWMFSTAYASAAPWNESFWENPRFNELLLTARSELNDDRRREMYWEMQTLCSDEGASLTPMFASYVMAHTDKLAHDEKVGANWTLDGIRAAERWWFA